MDRLKNIKTKPKLIGVLLVIVAVLLIIIIRLRTEENRDCFAFGSI